MDNADKPKRIRRSASQLREAKIASVEEKIRKHQEEIIRLKQELEELKKPPEWTKAEKQEFLKSKIEDGSLTREEAVQLGYKG